MSNLIKSSSYVPLEDIRKIEAVYRTAVDPDLRDLADAVDYEIGGQEEMLQESILLKEQMLQDAEMAALDLVRQAREDADRLIEEAKQAAERFWEEQRQKDDEFREQARQIGYDDGYGQGFQDAERQIGQQYEAMIAEGRTVLEQAYEASRLTIADAETFLIELSCAAAEKIIGRQLELSPHWVVDMIKQALKRSIDKGTVTLCVAPAQFSYVQSVRDELAFAIDAQAELQILPDASVRDLGCVIKTSFGSIDARVETQLTEIKRALLDICRRGDEASDE